MDLSNYVDVPTRFAAALERWPFVLGITFGFAEDTDSDLAEDSVVFHTTWGHIYQDDISKYQVLLGDKWITKDELDEPS